MTFRKVDLIFCGAGVAGRRRCGLAALSARPQSEGAANSVHQAITVESQCDLSCTPGCALPVQHPKRQDCLHCPRGQARKRKD